MSGNPNKEGAPPDSPEAFQAKLKVAQAEIEALKGNQKRKSLSRLVLLSVLSFAVALLLIFVPGAPRGWALAALVLVTAAVAGASALTLIEVRRGMGPGDARLEPLVDAQMVPRLSAAGLLMAVATWVTLELVATATSGKLPIVTPQFVAHTDGGSVTMVAFEAVAAPSAWPATLAFLGVIGALVTVIVAALVTLRLVLQDDA